MATGADTPAAEQAVATTCHQIQGTESVTYDNAAIVTLADKLNSSGVCPGVLQMLVPPTTAPASLLISSAGWTLVDVIDGDTLDIASAVEGQRRVQLIGINAPEPGECMGDEATNVLRLVATGKELKIVPDVSDADAEGNNLRYLEQLDGVDLGGTMIDLGLATAVPVEPDIARGGDYANEWSTPKPPRWACGRRAPVPHRRRSLRHCRRRRPRRPRPEPRGRQLRTKGVGTTRPGRRLPLTSISTSSPSMTSGLTNASAMPWPSTGEKLPDVTSPTVFVADDHGAAGPRGGRRPSVAMPTR